MIQGIIGFLIGVAFMMNLAGSSIQAFDSMQSEKLTEYNNKKYICQVVEEKGWIPVAELNPREESK